MTAPESTTLKSPHFPADKIIVRTGDGANVLLETHETAGLDDPQLTIIRVNAAELCSAIDKAAGKAETPDLEELEGEIADLLRRTRGEITQPERAKRIVSLVRDAFGVEAETPEWYDAKVIKVHWMGEDHFLTRRAGTHRSEPWIWDDGTFCGNKFIEETLGEVEIVA